MSGDQKEKEITCDVGGFKKKALGIGPKAAEKKKAHGVGPVDRARPRVFGEGYEKGTGRDGSNIGGTTT